MNVHGHGPQHTHSIGQMKRHQAQTTPDDKSLIKDTILGKSRVESTENEIANESTGVVRNLETGHFKGVADLRLRLNFQEQFQGATVKEAEQQIAEEAKALETTINSKVEELENSFEFTFEFSYSFSLSSSSRQSTPADRTIQAEEQALDVKSVFESFRNTFNTMFEELSKFNPDGIQNNNLVAADEIPVGETNPIDTTNSLTAALEVPEESTEDTQPEVSFTNALNELRDFFESELLLMEERITAVLTLPPVSPPQGNGVAYDRFLEMYNDRYGLAENSSEKENSESQGAVSTSV
ncbi:MAG: hypothetical protein ACN4GW_16735 [Desulforhopalus sp.]